MLHGEGLLAVVADSDIAQAQGLAWAVLKLPGVDASGYSNRLDVLPSVLVLCKIHFIR
jgi:hypothetical protein